MNLKLNVYDGKTVIKTYTAETLDCEFGIVEDILDALNTDDIKTGSKKEIGFMVIKCMKQLKPFLKDLFYGITDEELRKTKTSEIIDVFKGVFEFATGEIASATEGIEKN